MAPRDKSNSEPHVPGSPHSMRIERSTLILNSEVANLFLFFFSSVNNKLEITKNADPLRSTSKAGMELVLWLHCHHVSTTSHIPPKSCANATKVSPKAWTFGLVLKALIHIRGKMLVVFEFREKCEQHM